MSDIEREIKSAKLALAVSIAILMALVIFMVVRDKKKINTSKPVTSNVQQNINKNKENYKKLKDSFPTYEPTLSKIINGFKQLELLTANTDFSIAMVNGEIQENDQYYPKSIRKQINKNSSLSKELTKLAKEDYIRQISYLAKNHEVQFYISTEKTPYVTNNNGLGALFLYCTDKNCAKYGYQPLKENWYMWILPRPE